MYIYIFYLYNLACTPAIPMEVNIAFDAASIGGDNSKYVVKFVASVSDRLQHKPEDMRIATVTTGCKAENFDDFVLGSGHDTQKVAISLLKNRFPVMASLIRKMRLKFKNKDVKNVGILFISNRLSKRDFLMSKKQMRRAAFMGMQVFVVGIGNHVDNFQGVRLASSSNHYFFSPNFEKLLDLDGRLILSICKIE